MDEDDGDDEDDIKLEARTDAGKHITAMLSSLLLKDAKSTQVARACLSTPVRLIFTHRVPRRFRPRSPGAPSPMPASRSP